MLSAGLPARRAAEALHKRVALDTAFQPKAITFPTDARLVRVATKGLKRLAREHGVRLRQSYVRIAKRRDDGRTHAHQAVLAPSAAVEHVADGRIRDMRRKPPRPDQQKSQAFVQELTDRDL